MNKELMNVNYQIYVDLLKKGEIPKCYLRTYKLINDLINKKYIIESYALIRTLFEEFLYELAVKADNSFVVNIDTKPREIRKKVTDNLFLLFGEDSVDKQSIDYNYGYLSKMTHESTIKEMLKDMLSNKKFISLMQANAKFMLIVIGHFYLCSLYKDSECKDMIDYIYVVCGFVLMDESKKLHFSLSLEEKEHYSNYYLDLNDKKYLEKESEIAIDSVKELNNDGLNIGLNQMANKFSVLLNKYGYYNLYKEALALKE